jgi:hypothetical protein
MAAPNGYGLIIMDWKAMDWKAMDWKAMDGKAIDWKPGHQKATT